MGIDNRNTYKHLSDDDRHIREEEFSKMLGRQAKEVIVDLGDLRFESPSSQHLNATAQQKINDKVLSREVAQFAKQVTQIENAYKELEKGIFSKQTYKSEVQGISKIVNDLRQSNHSPISQLKETIQLLESKYEEQRKHYDETQQKKIIKTGRKNFIGELNAKQSDHHYSRLVGLELKNGYELMKKFDPAAHGKFEQDVVKIATPSYAAYQYTNLSKKSPSSSLASSHPEPEVDVHSR